MTDHDVDELGAVADAADRMAALEAGTTTVGGEPAPRSQRGQLWAPAAFVVGAVGATAGLILPLAGGLSAPAGRGVAAAVTVAATAALVIATVLVSIAEPVRDGRAVLLGLAGAAAAGFLLCTALPAATRGGGGLDPATALALTVLAMGSGLVLAGQARRVGTFVSVCSRYGWWLLAAALVPAAAAAVLAASGAVLARASRWTLYVACLVALAAAAAAVAWVVRERSRPAFGAAAAALLLLAAAVTCAASDLTTAAFWSGEVLAAAAAVPAVGAVVLEYRKGRRVAVAVESIMEWSPEGDLADHLGEAADTMLRAVRLGTDADEETTHRVIEWSLGMARRLDLPPGRMRVISLGALFHDVGKIAIPEDVLNKPGELTPLERRLVEQHPTAGFQLAARVNMLWEAAVAIRHHHEWIDGSGYPDGLRGEEIPIESRIIAVCDMYEALTTPRPYREAMDREDALMMMRAEVGTHLDPDCFAAFEAVLSGSDRVVPLLRER